LVASLGGWIFSMSAGKPSSTESQPDDPAEKISGTAQTSAEEDRNEAGTAAVDAEEDGEPVDPHPDTPDDLDDDVPLRESVESVQNDA